MPKLRLTGRKAVLAGVSAAAATAAVVAMAAPAAAAPSQLTSCSETVRVRSQPAETSPVIGSCKAGERVTVDGTRNGYAHLVNKRGWASLDYVRLRDAENSDLNNDNNNDNGDNVDNNGDSNGNETCNKDDGRYHYDNGDKYKCRNGKRKYVNYNNDYNNHDDKKGLEKLLGG